MPAARRRPWLRMHVDGDVGSGLAAVASIVSDALAAGGRGGEQDSDPLRAADARFPARPCGTRKTRAASNVSPASRTDHPGSGGASSPGRRTARAQGTTPYEFIALSAHELGCRGAVSRTVQHRLSVRLFEAFDPRLDIPCPHAGVDQ